MSNENKFLTEDEKRAIRVHERQELKKLERKNKHKKELFDKIADDEEVGKFHVPIQLVALETLLLGATLILFMSVMWGFYNVHTSLSLKLIGYSGLFIGMTFFALIVMKKNIREADKIQKEKNEILKAIREEYY